MKLVKKVEKSEGDKKMVSFRLSEEARHTLKQLGRVLEKSMAEVLEDLIAQGREAVEKKFPGELKKFGGKRND